MKKASLFFVFALALGLLGCEWYGAHNTTITNESDFYVTFNLVQVGTRTIHPNGSVRERNQRGAVINSYESCTPRRVRYEEINGRYGRFVNLQSIPVNVYNTLSIIVTLEAGGYLEAEEVVISPGSKDTVPSNTIYTETPIFTVSSDSFPAIADFQIFGGVMFVTIR